MPAQLGLAREPRNSMVEAQRRANRMAEGETDGTSSDLYRGPVGAVQGRWNRHSATFQVSAASRGGAWMPASARVARSTRRR